MVAAVVAWFAVGCPVCNKLVVLALGTGGATSYFEPIQPLLGLASIAVLLAAYVTRRRRATACALPVAV